MLEELQTPPSESEAPDTDTQAQQEADSVPEGAEPSSEDSSIENAHPEDESSEGGENDEAEKPFHVEGKMVFKTKEEYIKHINKQRGAASQMASEYKRMKERMEKLEASLSQISSAKTQEKPPEDDLEPEQRQALETIKKYGQFLTPEELQRVLEEQLAPVRSLLSQVEKEKFEAAQAAVTQFMDMNPDAEDHREDIADLMERMGKAGVEVDIEKAYFLVTGRQARTQVAAKKEAEKRAIKKAQAAGSPSSSSGAATIEEDILARILSS